MVGKVIGVCVTLLVALSVSAQVSSNAGSELAGQSTAFRVREHGPRKALGLHPDRVIDGVTVAESSNWSGYAVTGAWFTQVKGSWTVPAVDCTALPDSSASFWVGLDGWVTDTVEQTGTDSDCDGETAHYYSWFEFFPNAGVTITSVPVSPGDQMSAEVIYNGTEFAVSITNESTGNSYRKSAIVALAQRVSAEWIAEMNGYRLSEFDTVFFGEDYTGVRGTNYAVDESTSGSIGAFVNHVWESVLVNGKSVEAVPSSLSADGTSFAVEWKSE
jgi:peptidase A4-like protein